VSRARLAFLGRLGLSVLLLVALIAVAGDDRLPEVIRRLGIVVFVISAVLNTCGSIILPAAVTHRFNRSGEVDLDLRQFVLINFSIRFYTMVLPRASATAVRWAKYRAASSGAAAAAVVVLEKIIQIVVYAGASLLFLVLERDATGDAFVWLAGSAAVLVAVSGAGLVAFFSNRLDPLFRRLEFIVSIRWIGSRIAQVVASAKSYRSAGGSEVWPLVGWTIAGYSFFVASAWVIADGLSLGVPLLGLVWMRGLVFLSTLIPITIAGAGVREAGFVGFMSLYDIDGSEALGFALCLLGVQVAIASVGGCIELYSLVSRRRRPQPEQGP